MKGNLAMLENNNLRFPESMTQEGQNILPDNEQNEPLNSFKPIPPESVNNDREDLSSDFTNQDFDDEDGEGSIAVQATTARGASPVSEATVIIYKVRNGERNIVSFNLTDRSGKTPDVLVPAPKKSNSQSPSSSLPFANYNITVRHPMYYTAEINNVQVFGDEKTIQTVDLIPLPEFVNERDTTRTTVIPRQNL